MAPVVVVDPVMTEDQAQRLIEAWERFPVYTPSGTGSWGRKMQRRQRRRAARERAAGTPGGGRSGGDAPSAASAAAAAGGRRPAPPRGRGFAPGLDQRVDSRINYLRQGGLRGDYKDPLLTARHKYFRETLLDGNDVFAPGVEEFLSLPSLADAARQLYGLDVVEPWNVYANVMLPGQELGMHSDIPEFRGAHRNFLPGWFMCAMQLSGLFERWRVKIATGVTYLVGSEEGGAFVCYPDGPLSPPRSFPATHNTAVVLDTDSIFHGVDRVPGECEAISQITADSRLVPTGGGRWSLRCGPKGELEEVATFHRDELRLSVSWKGYCFADDEERAARTAPDDSLTVPSIVDTMVAELVARGRLPGPDHGLDEEDLGMLIIEEFIPFPPEPALATAASGAEPAGGPAGGGPA